MNELIREGFICPECQEDLTSFDLLQLHFELKHSKELLQQSDDKSNALSNVLAKAKTLFKGELLPQTGLNNNNNNEQQATQTQQSAFGISQPQSAAVSLSSVKYHLSYNQENGYFRSHTQEFKDQRDKTVGRYVIQTNKLLITLDKLISNESTKDENKRKLYEMSIVPWIPDTDVNLCPTCARSFGILHRKHHCRLCGCIMCNKCSQFLAFTLAKQLTNPTMFVTQMSNELKFKRSNSDTSVNSHYLNVDDKSNGGGGGGNNETYLRLCVECSKLLNKKYRSLKDKANRPKIFELYDEFYTCIKESERMAPVYSKMAESLSAGETVHSLKATEDMRIQLIQLFQKIDLISNKILTFGVTKNPNQPSNNQTNTTNTTNEASGVSKDQLKLQKNIRLYAINHLKEYSFTLPTLPTEAEYEKLKAQKQKYLIEELQRETHEKMQLKRELDRNKATQQQNKNQQTTNNLTINNADGWIAANSNNCEANIDVSQDDPIQIQIQVVKNFLNEARKQNRTEEIKILEANLKELEEMAN